jgi:hypothetical protein
MDARQEERMSDEATDGQQGSRPTNSRRFGRRRRRIVVLGVEYRWRFGRGGWLEVRLEGRVFLREPVTAVRGIDWDTFERGTRKRTGDCSVLPRHVRDAIMRRLSSGG